MYARTPRANVAGVNIYIYTAEGKLNREEGRVESEEEGRMRRWGE